MIRYFLKVKSTILTNPTAFSKHHRIILTLLTCVKWMKKVIADRKVALKSLLYLALCLNALFQKNGKINVAIYGFVAGALDGLYTRTVFLLCIVEGIVIGREIIEAFAQKTTPVTSRQNKQD